MKKNLLIIPLATFSLVLSCNKGYSKPKTFERLCSDSKYDVYNDKPYTYKYREVEMEIFFARSPRQIHGETQVGFNLKYDFNFSGQKGRITMFTIGYDLASKNSDYYFYIHPRIIFNIYSISVSTYEPYYKKGEKVLSAPGYKKVYSHITRETTEEPLDDSDRQLLNEAVIPWWDMGFSEYLTKIGCGDGKEVNFQEDFYNYFQYLDHLD